jgi:hypothetical protein
VSIRRVRFFVSVVLACGVFAVVGVAAGAAGGSVELVTPRTVAVNYTNCKDPQGNPSPCLTFSYSVVNNTSQTANCWVGLAGQPSSGYLPLTIAARISASVSTTTPYTGQRYVVVKVICSEPNVRLSKRITVVS